jgi:hypothetical protein
VSPVEKKWTLEQLLAQVTEDNLHGEVKIGSAAGQKV